MMSSMYKFNVAWMVRHKTEKVKNVKHVKCKSVKKVKM